MSFDWVAILTGLWETLCEMAPYLLFGFAVAGVLSVVISPAAVERHLGGGGLWPIVKASLFGVPLPLCSCSVIPVATSVRRHGASKGATSAFLISTPQTGVDSIFATFSLLGPVFAVFRPLAAFVSGVLGGAAVELVSRGETAEQDHVEACHDGCCSKSGTKKSKAARALQHGFVTLPRDIGRPLLVGLVIAGLIAVAIPDSFFAEKLGTGLLAMLVMMLLGVPVYVCATASIPVAAAMMMKGVSPGAALVFLMTGPATNAAAIATLWKIMGRRIAIVYLLAVVVTALGSGVTMDLLVQTVELGALDEMKMLVPPRVQQACAVILLGVLVPTLLPRKRKHADETAQAE